MKNENLEGELRRKKMEMGRVEERREREIKGEGWKVKGISKVFGEMENGEENIEEVESMGIENKDMGEVVIGKEI